MIAQGWTLAVPTLYSVGLRFPRIFKNVEIARSSTLEPKYNQYLIDYQIV